MAAKSKVVVLEVMTKDGGGWGAYKRLRVCRVFDTRNMDEAKAVAESSDTAAFVVDEYQASFSWGRGWDFDKDRTPEEVASVVAGYAQREDCLFANGKAAAHRNPVKGGPVTVVRVEKATKNVVRETLPVVAEVLAIDDCGSGGGICPHCGATGRWVIHFIDETGNRRGAMRGCFGLFPKAQNLRGAWMLNR